MNEHRLFDIHHLRVAPAAGPGGLVSSRDALFAMLDGQLVQGSRRTWRAEVISILEDGDQRWVQIGPARRPANSVVLRLAALVRADEAIEALRRWTDLPAERRPALIDLVSR